MPCYNPMIAERTDEVNPKTGKNYVRFLRSVKNAGVPDDVWRDFGEALAWSVDYETGEFINHAIVLPCGQCLGCRTQYAAQWANRIMIEAMDYESVYFLTLTYDDEHVPRHIAKDGHTVFSLEPEDFKLFQKRLARHQAYHKDNRLRYYYVGEYGETFHRPHGHFVEFGLLLDDVVEDHRNKHGRMIHTSKNISDIWGKGIVEVEPITWELAAYVARYTVKKLGRKETDFYSSQNLVPEFSRMSLKPAIGFKYFDEHCREIYVNDEILLPLATGLRKVKPPRFYDNKYDDIYPSDMAEVKGNRQKIAKEQLKLKLDRFSGSYLELLHNEEVVFKNRTKSLRRELEL